MQIIRGEAHENWRTAMAAIEATGDASLWRGLYVWTERERVGLSQVAPCWRRSADLARLVLAGSHGS